MQSVGVEADGKVLALAGQAVSRVRPLAALALAMLLASLGTSIANVALPTLAQAFGAGFQDVQWVVLAYLLTVTCVVVSVGRLGDLIGRRRLLLAGLLLFSLGSALCGAAPGLWSLVAARVAQGGGAAVMMALTMAFVGEIVPKERTGSAMGLLGTMSAVGTALGPTLGGLLIAGFGWRAVFLVGLPLGVLAFLLAWRFLPQDRARDKAERPRIDVTGTMLLALTLAAYTLAMTLGRGQFAAINAALLAAAALGLVLFIVVEARVAAPLVRLAMFRDPTLSIGFILGALVMTVLMTTLVVGPFYLAGGLGLAPAEIGLVMSAGPIVSALTGIPAGRVVDRFGAARMTQAGLAAIVLGCAGLAAIPARFGIPGYVLPLIVTTAGYALFQAANNTAVMKDVPQANRGVVSGLLNLSRNLGLVTGASAMGAVFAYASGAASHATAQPAAVATGMHTTFAVAAALIAAALAIAAISLRSAQNR